MSHVFGLLLLTNFEDHTTNLSLCINPEMSFQIAAIFNKFPATRSVELHIFYILLIAGCWQKNPEIQRKARAYICIM